MKPMYVVVEVNSIGRSLATDELYDDPADARTFASYQQLDAGESEAIPGYEVYRLVEVVEL